MKLLKFCYFFPERPKLIHIEQPLLDALSDKKEWVAERKYNGSRLQLHSINGKLEFWNRHGEKMSYTPPPDVGEALGKLPGYCLLDGELRHNKVPKIQDKIMFYDTFIWNGELLVSQPFWYRRNLLKKLFKCNAEPVGVTEQFLSGFKDVFHEVIKDQEIEGLVIKNTRGILNLGRTGNQDSNWMYKVRRPSNSYRF